jgi:hypothetical protein
VHPPARAFLSKATQSAAPPCSALGSSLPRTTFAHASFTTPLSSTCHTCGRHAQSVTAAQLPVQVCKLY